MFRNAAALVAVCWSLMGCAMLQGQVTAFHQMGSGAGAGKKTVVLPADQNRQHSLEFASYRSIIAAHLAAKGFVVVEDLKDSEVAAFVGYDIDNGTTTTSISSTPVYGYTGGGSRSVSSTVYGPGGPRQVSETVYTPPVFGVVGTSTSCFTTRTFRRVLTVSISERPASAGATPRTIYEGKLVSQGACGAIAQVFPLMAGAMFKDWPGVSGKTSTVTVTLDKSPDC